MLPLSKRLHCLIEGAAGAHTVADVGTDHGWVPIALALQGAEHVAAIDISPAALDVARKHCHRNGLADRVQLLCGDGLDPWPHSALQAAIFAGMYGHTMREALDRAFAKNLRPERLVLQPTRGLHRVRRWLTQRGYVVRKEWLIWENGRYHITVAAWDERDAPVKTSTNEEDEWLGPCLRRERGPLFERWAAEQLAHWTTIDRALRAANRPRPEAVEEAQSAVRAFTSAR